MVDAVKSGIPRTVSDQKTRSDSANVERGKDTNEGPLNRKNSESGSGMGSRRLRNYSIFI
jgi:hypothetical protein